LDGRFVLIVDLKGKMSIWEIQKKSEREKKSHEKSRSNEIKANDFKVSPLLSLITNKELISFKTEAGGGIVICVL
jgi:hypothetical protein